MNVFDGYKLQPTEKKGKKMNNIFLDFGWLPLKTNEQIYNNIT